jgi:lantibiotic leader peptide-processing serine protease
MANKFLTRNNLLYAAAIAFIGLTSCNPEEDLSPADDLRAGSVQLTQDADNPNNVKIRTNHYIVLSTTDRLPAGLEKGIASANGKVTSAMKEAGVATAYSEDPDFIAKASRVSGVRSVIHDIEIQWINPAERKVFALENYGNPPASGDDDPFFDLQWGHAAISAPAAWNAGARGANARVAVLDTGFDMNHPDLAPNILQSASVSFVPGEPVNYILNDPFSHGTHTAGTIAAADNGYGVIGVAPEAKLILVKVLSDVTGSGAFSWIMDGIVHATQQGAHVINMSLGASLPRHDRYRHDNGTPDDPTDDYYVNQTRALQELFVALDRVTRYANQNGVLVLASAGNSARNGNTDKSLTHVPSGSVGVVSISATAPIGWAADPYNTFMDNLASYSNYGTPDVDFAAPGGDWVYPGNESAVIAGLLRPVWVFDLVFSTGNGGGFYWSAGTSMASPHAAGVAALIIGKNGGRMTPAHVLTKMRATADDLGKPGRDPLYGYGRLNAYRAVTE